MPTYTRSPIAFRSMLILVVDFLSVVQRGFLVKNSSKEIES